MGNARNIAFWVVLFLLILALFNLFSGSGGTLQSREISYSEFVQSVENGEVSQVTLDGEQVRFRAGNGQDYVTIKPEDAEITQLLIEAGIPVKAEQQQQSGFQTFILSLLPFLLLIGVWIYFMNRMQGGGKGGAMGFGKSRAKLLTEKQGRVTFDDVAGIDEAKKNWKRLLNSFATRRNSPALAARSRPVRCWWVLQAQVKRYWLAPLQVRQACRSSPSPARTSSKCLSVSEHPVCATCSNRPRRTHRVSCSSTKLTPLVAIVALDMAAAMTNANRR